MIETKEELGVHFPPKEKHLTGMLHRGKVGLVDGKGTYQLHKLRKAMEFVPENRRRVCLDVGAHVGLWAMHLCKLFETVHCFEPVPMLRDIFEMNMAGQKNWQMHPVALSDAEAELTLDLREHDTGNTHVVPSREGAPEPNGEPVLIRAQAVPLDFTVFEAVDFIKIDVEGWELPVVQGGRGTILRHRPVIIIEQKGNGEKWYGHEERAAVKFLEGLGMRSAKVDAGDHIMIWD